MTKDFDFLKYLRYLIFVSIFVFYGCGSTKTDSPQTAESVFKEAMEKYKDGSFLDAQNLFNVITLQYPASQYADDAQYYYAECNFAHKEYIMAAYNYNLLRKVYPTSEYSKQALYKVAQCYFELSPTYDRDQEYTNKAIQAYNEYITVFAKDSLAIEGSKRITELRNKLGNREYFTAQLYETLMSYRSALIYYNSIIENYQDTKFYEPAYFNKIKILVLMKKNEDARHSIE